MCCYYHHSVFLLAGDSKDQLDKDNEEYSTLATDKKTSTLSLPPSYSDLNIDKQNNIQMTRFAMKTSGNGIDTIPEGEPEYDVIADSKYENLQIEAAMKQKQQQSLSMAASKTPPARPYEVHEKQLVVSDRAQSHNVIPTSPNGIVEKKGALNSCSSNNITNRPQSQEIEKREKPWYSSTPSIAASPAHLTAPAAIQPSHNKTSSPPVSPSHFSSQPSSDVITSTTASSVTSPSSQSMHLSPRHQPVRKMSSSTPSVSSKSGSRPASRSGSRQSMNRSIPELLNDAKLPTSDV